MSFGVILFDPHAPASAVPLPAVETTVEPTPAAEAPAVTPAVVTAPTPSVVTQPTSFYKLPVFWVAVAVGYIVFRR